MLGPEYLLPITHKYAGAGSGSGTLKSRNRIRNKSFRIHNTGQNRLGDCGEAPGFQESSKADWSWVTGSAELWASGGEEGRGHVVSNVWRIRHGATRDGDGFSYLAPPWRKIWSGPEG